MIEQKETPLRHLEEYFTLCDGRRSRFSSALPFLRILHPRQGSEICGVEKASTHSFIQTIEGNAVAK